MRRPLIWLGLLAALTLLVAACGDENILSDEEYFEALEDVGADSDARAEPLFEALGDEPDAETALAFLAGFHALYVEAREGVATLAAPSDLAAANRAFVDAADAVIVAIEKARVRVEAGDLASVFAEVEPAAFERFRRACAALEQLARDRGFTVELSCADE